MSNGFKLEILIGRNDVGDEMVYLNYWDYIAGDDILFEIVNSKAYMRKGDSLTACDLPTELTKLARSLLGLDDMLGKASEG